MPNINSGSIAANILSGISPMPAGISGNLPTLIETQRYFIENWTGDSIGSVYAEKYQPAITDLSTSNVLKLMAVQDFGIQRIMISGRELEVDNSNLMEMAKQLEGRAMLYIKSLQKGAKIGKARGG